MDTAHGEERNAPVETEARKSGKAGPVNGICSNSTAGLVSLFLLLILSLRGTWAPFHFEWRRRLGGMERVDRIDGHNSDAVERAFCYEMLVSRKHDPRRPWAYRECCRSLERHYVKGVQRRVVE